MKKLLIIRSASFQQLDTNLLEIRKKFAEYEIHILTHEHGKKLAEKYNDIAKIWIYPYKKGFSYFNQVEELKSENFDAVIIPVTNISGSSFSNVFLFSLSIKTKQRYMCNLVSSIIPVNKTGIIGRFLLNNIYKLLSIVLTGLFGSILAVVLLARLSFSNKRRS